MHVAMIVDEERLGQDEAMLDRVAVGLRGEGVELTNVRPPAGVADADVEAEAFTTDLLTSRRVLPPMRREMTRVLAESIERVAPEVLFAHGERAWRLGIDLARRLERPLALEVWSAGQVRQLPRGRKAALVAALVAPTAALADALGEQIGRDLVCCVPLGVAIPPRPREIFGESPVALAVIGGGRDVPAYRAMLGGLSRLSHDGPPIQAFVELRGPYEHEIWRHARRLDLLDSISAIGDANHHRSLLTCCDALVVPERFGEIRSLRFEAMASGIPVIASHDPYLDMLTDGVNAEVVAEPDTEAWARGLRRLVSDPDHARALGEAGRAQVTERNRTRTQISRLSEILSRVATGGTYAFES
jgi:hypothetical protein